MLGRLSVNFTRSTSLQRSIICLTYAVFVACGAVRAAEDQAQTVAIYTGHVPPYVAPANGIAEISEDIVGTIMPKVTQYLSARGVEPNITLLPWSAAFRRARGSKAGLIFPLDRTAEREHQFHWITPLSVNAYHIYGLADGVGSIQTVQDIVSLSGQVSCTSNSVQCSILREVGLPPENILTLEGATIPDRYKLMVRQRNLFSIFDPLVFEFLMTKHGLESSRLRRLIKVGERTAYLAAPMGTDPDLLARLK